MKIFFKAIVFAGAIAGSNLFPVCNANAQGPIINIPDINFKYYVLFNFDANSDGDIDSTEAANVTSPMNLYSFGIADLTGIEAFTAITYLDCGSNAITSLDVSANTALTDLDCSSNQLTSLDVSANTSLAYLNCLNNALTGLDVSANTSLTVLSCGVNLIRSLDISHNSALTQLVCHMNQLTSLNVKNGNNTNFSYFYAQNNPDLFCIQVDNPAYSDTASNWYEDLTAYYSSNCPLGMEDLTSHAETKTEIYPNPFTEQTTIRYSIASPFGSALIQISDNSNRVLKTVVINNSGKGELIINANEFTAGSYQYSIIVDGKVVDTKQMVLSK